MIVQPDEYGAGKLLQMQSPSSFGSTKFDNSGLLSTLRQHLKLNNFHSIEALQDAFQQKDKVVKLNRINHVFNFLVDRKRLEKSISILYKKYVFSLGCPLNRIC